MGRTRMPGVFISSRNCDRPACFSASGRVRTSAIIRWQSRAWVVQIFWPLMRQPPATCVARVRTEARSEPAPGSLMPMHV